MKSTHILPRRYATAVHMERIKRATRTRTYELTKVPSSHPKKNTHNFQLLQAIHEVDYTAVLFPGKIAALFPNDARLGSTKPHRRKPLNRRGANTPTSKRGGACNENPPHAKKNEPRRLKRKKRAIKPTQVAYYVCHKTNNQHSTRDRPTPSSKPAPSSSIVSSNEQGSRHKRAHRYKTVF